MAGLVTDWVIETVKTAFEVSSQGIILFTNLGVPWGKYVCSLSWPLTCDISSVVSETALEVR